MKLHGSLRLLQDVDQIVKGAKGYKRNLEDQKEESKESVTLNEQKTIFVNNMIVETSIPLIPAITLPQNIKQENNVIAEIKPPLIPAVTISQKINEVINVIAEKELLLIPADAIPQNISHENNVTVEIIPPLIPANEIPQNIKEGINEGLESLICIPKIKEEKEEEKNTFQDIRDGTSVSKSNEIGIEVGLFGRGDGLVMGTDNIGRCLELNQHLYS